MGLAYLPEPLLRLERERGEAREQGDNAQLDAHHGDGVHVGRGLGEGASSGRG